MLHKHTQARQKIARGIEAGGHLLLKQPLPLLEQRTGAECTVGGCSALCVKGGGELHASGSSTYHLCVGGRGSTVERLVLILLLLLLLLLLNIDRRVLARVLAAS